MFTDRYYTSIPLAEELMKMKCHLTGTIKTNRKGIPKLPKKQFSHQETFISKKGEALFLAWRDKRVVSLLGTWNDAGMMTARRILRGGKEINIRKPNAIASYTASLGGVDTQPRIVF